MATLLDQLPGGLQADTGVGSGYDVYLSADIFCGGFCIDR
jgi:hypothetical protein